MLPDGYLVVDQKEPDAVRDRSRISRTQCCLRVAGGAGVIAVVVLLCVALIVRKSPVPVDSQAIISASALRPGNCVDATPPAQKTTLVVVRAHNPHPGMLQRMAEFAEDLSRHPEVSLTLMNSLDTTNLGVNETNITKKISEIPHTMYHQINSSVVRKEYPIWNTQGWGPSGYNAHMEFLIQAAQQVRRAGQLHDDGYVWMVEDDVGICGNISELIASYGNDTSDFIGSQNITHPPIGIWCHIHEYSEEFGRRYNDTNIWQCEEPVERFSVRFLLHLDDLIRNHNITAQSEMFAPTICMHSKEFTCSSLKMEHRFPRRYYFSNALVTEWDWGQICPAGQCHSPPRIAYNLKW